MKELAMRDHCASILEGSAKRIRNDTKHSLDELIGDFMEIFSQTLDHGELNKAVGLVTEEIRRRRNKIFPSGPPAHPI